MQHYAGFWQIQSHIIEPVEQRGGWNGRGWVGNGREEDKPPYIQTFWGSCSHMHGVATGHLPCRGNVHGAVGAVPGHGFPTAVLQRHHPLNCDNTGQQNALQKSRPVNIGQALSNVNTLTLTLTKPRVKKATKPSMKCQEAFNIQATIIKQKDSLRIPSYTLGQILPALRVRVRV